MRNNKILRKRFDLEDLPRASGPLCHVTKLKAAQLADRQCLRNVYLTLMKYSCWSEWKPITGNPSVRLPLRCFLNKLASYEPEHGRNIWSVLYASCNSTSSRWAIERGSGGKRRKGKRKYTNEGIADREEAIGPQWERYTEGKIKNRKIEQLQSCWRARPQKHGNVKGECFLMSLCSCSRAAITSFNSTNKEKDRKYVKMMEG